MLHDLALSNLKNLARKILRFFPKKTPQSSSKTRNKFQYLLKTFLILNLSLLNFKFFCLKKPQLNNFLDKRITYTFLVQSLVCVLTPVPHDLLKN